MAVDQALVERVVTRVLAEAASKAEIEAATRAAPVTREVLDGVFDDMDAAIAAAVRAHRAYQACTMADRARFVAAIREVVLRPEHLDHMSSATVEETRMGCAADKREKNRAVAQRTPGVEDLTTQAWSGDAGLTTLECSSYGVIGAITPTTNPTETVICNAIGMLAAGNTVVFSPHPRAKAVSVWLVRTLNEALAAVGAPPNLLVTLREPSIETTQAMMGHPDVRMLVATGGPAIVGMVLRSGKKAIGAGAGNPPVVVDETADIARAARDIVDGASFDNNLPCTAEKELVVVDSVADALRFHMTRSGAYEVRDRDVLERLERLVLTPEGNPAVDWMGKPAVEILAAIGVRAPAETRLVIVETAQGHPFVQREMLMPVLPIVRVADVDAAIELAVELEHGLRHTAVMHSQNVSRLTQMARRIQTTVFVKNGPSYAGLGIGGEGHCSFTIAGPTGEGLTSARSFARMRRCVLVGDLNVR